MVTEIKNRLSLFIGLIFAAILIFYRGIKKALKKNGIQSQSLPLGMQKFQCEKLEEILSWKGVGTQESINTLKEQIKFKMGEKRTLAIFNLIPLSVIFLKLH